MSFRSFFLPLFVGPVALLGLGAALAGVALAGTPPEPDAALAAAVEALQKNRLDEARGLLQAALKARPDCASCLYDLGLVEHRDGHAGLAIGLWRKAAAAAPGYQAPRRAVSWAFAKLERQDVAHELDLSETVRDYVLEPVGAWAFELSSVVLLFAAAWRAIDWLAARKGDDRPVPWGAIGLAAAFLVCLGLTAAKWIDRAVPRATIAPQKVPALSAPDPGSAPLFDLYEGLEVIVRQSKGGWTQVSYPGGSTGWVPNSAIVRMDGGS